MDLELEKFKCEINLAAFVSTRGYQVDKRASSRGCMMMRHENGDKIGISRHEDGHWIYYSVRNEQDNGTIIDFLQNRGSKNLGEIRKKLRPLIGKFTDREIQFVVEKQHADRISVAKAFEEASKFSAPSYLINRGLTKEILTSARFVDTWRVDKRNNVLFPHFDSKGIVGFEIKNKEFTGFAAGGTKTLWTSNQVRSDSRLVLTESAIDAISHAQLFPSRHSCYASVGGSINQTQPDIVKDAISRLPAGSEIVMAFDNDRAGYRLREQIAALVPREYVLYNHAPKNYGSMVKDWNDVVRTKATRDRER